MKAAGNIALAPLLFATTFLFSAPIALSQSTYTIRGRVLDESGAQIGASVRLYSVERVLDLKSGDDGKFAFANLAQGKYELEVSSPGFITYTVAVEAFGKVHYTMDGAPVLLKRVVPEPSSIKLRMEYGGHCTVQQVDRVVRSPGVNVAYESRSGEVDLAGMVRDELGSPLSAVTLNLVRDGTSHETVSNDKGEFTYTGLEPGKYTLRAPSLAIGKSRTASGSRAAILLGPPSRWLTSAGCRASVESKREWRSILLILFVESTSSHSPIKS